MTYESVCSIQIDGVKVQVRNQESSFNEKFEYFFPASKEKHSNNLVQTTALLEKMSKDYKSVMSMSGNIKQSYDACVDSLA